MKESEFYKYFETIYKQRWPDLFAALQVKEKQILRLNKFSQAPTSYDLKKISENTFWLSDEFQRKNKEISRDKNSILNYYIMDPASYLATEFFPINSNDVVLDMCAAPGGKALILAEKVYAEGQLFANELSESRRDRLIKVIQNYIPRECRDRIWVKGWDAQFFGLKMPETFDKILLDAPCSGERYQLEKPKELLEWSLKKSERLAVRQYSLLASAYLALKPGGTIMYSTCSINPVENDQIIARLLKKKKNIEVVIEVLNKVNPVGGIEPERTELGFIYLPDKHGFGPIYFSLLQRF